MAKLVLSAEGSIVSSHFIDRTRVSVGRDADNDIVVPDAAVSAHHAEIVSVGEDQILVDLSCQGGTFVNGQKVSRHILSHRDVIEFGRYSLSYLNSKTSGESDLERTMIIKAVPDLLRAADAQRKATTPVTHAARAASVRFPGGRILRRSGGSGSECVELDRVVTLVGVPGKQLAVITRRPQGFFLTHVDGRVAASVNRRSIGVDSQAVQLRHGDVIEVAGRRYEFQLDSAT